MVYDISKKQSFQSIDKWYTELKEQANNRIVVLLVGNKSDLKTHRQVSFSEAKAYAEK